MKKIYSILIILTLSLTAFSQLEQVNRGTSPGAGDGEYLYYAWGKFNNVVIQVTTNTTKLDSIALGNATVNDVLYYNGTGWVSISSDVLVSNTASVQSLIGFMNDPSTVIQLGSDLEWDGDTIKYIGLEFAADEKAKLAAIESGATADQTGSEIVGLINTELGATSWQLAGSGSGIIQVDTIYFSENEISGGSYPLLNIARNATITNYDFEWLGAGTSYTANGAADTVNVFVHTETDSFPVVGIGNLFMQQQWGKSIAMSPQVSKWASFETDSTYYSIYFPEAQITGGTDTLITIIQYK